MSSFGGYRASRTIAGLGLLGVTVVAGAWCLGQGTTASGHQPSANPCGAPPNKVVAENCQGGSPSTEWDVNGAGDPAIQGFATQMSVNVGETVAYKIKTHSPAYRIDVYRMGYYGGQGARRITTIRPSVRLPQAQPECIHESRSRMVDCGNWAISATWTVPADATSGIYFARLVREDSDPLPWRADNAQDPPRRTRPAPVPHAYGALGFGKLEVALKEPKASHIVFVVRDDAGKSDLLFQTSDPTWQAYNRYGGTSTYGSYMNGSSIGGIAQRAFKVSYNRPLTTREASVINQVFAAEYPMVRWLEANGYDVSYFAGVDTDRYGDRIRQHKVLLSNGHDEYWSGGQRAALEAARDAGVHLSFFSGNAGFWKTRWEPSIDGTGTRHRTIVTYKETHSRLTPSGQLTAGRKIDPEKGVWTGTWRDASPYNPEGARPENQLTGVVATVGPYRLDPLEVPGPYGRMRFWRNTTVSGMRPQETTVLDGVLLGHQWDEDLDNGLRPPGLVQLSETIVHNVPYVQDWGSVYDSGTATHHLTLYRAASGALVFAAGTVKWSWGLDPYHDNHTAVPATRVNGFNVRVLKDPMGPDRRVQQATVNLLADMGVQPRSLQPGLVPAAASQDKSGPVSRIHSPEDGTLLSARRLVVTGSARDVGGGVVGSVEVSIDGGATWHPAAGGEAWSCTLDLPPDVHEVNVLSRAIDDSLNLERPAAGVKLRVAGRVTTNR